MESIRIKSNAIKSDGTVTVMTGNLEVSRCRESNCSMQFTFQNAEDETNFKEMVKDLKIENDPRMQLYLLNSMSFAGVGFMVD